MAGHCLKPFHSGGTRLSWIEFEPAVPGILWNSQILAENKRKSPWNMEISLRLEALATQLQLITAICVGIIKNWNMAAGADTTLWCLSQRYVHCKNVSFLRKHSSVQWMVSRFRPNLTALRVTECILGCVNEYLAFALFSSANSRSPFLQSRKLQPRE